jgi:hypothetical protein
MELHIANIILGIKKNALKREIVEKGLKLQAEIYDLNKVLNVMKSIITYSSQDVNENKEAIEEIELQLLRKKQEIESKRREYMQVNKDYLSIQLLTKHR